jgi:hypothetical protein
MAIVQGHLHLDTSVNLGGEKAPPTKWVAIQRAEVPVVFINVRRTKKAHLKNHVLTSDGSTPVLLQNMRYRLKIRAEGADTTQDRRLKLLSMYGKTVYLVDHMHCVDGQDHTPYVRTMVLSKVGEFPVDHPTLDFYYVDIELEDASLT